MQPQRFCEEIRLTDKDNTIDVKGLSVSSGKLVLGDASAAILFPANINPSTDNARQIGDSTHRLTTVYTLAINGGASVVNINNIGFGTNQKISTYANINTDGMGVPAIYSAPQIPASTKTANSTISTYTPPSAVGIYEISAVITTTAGTNTGTVQITVDYVDSQSTTHTGDVIPLVDAAGSVATTKTGASKEFHSLLWTITTDASGAAIVPKVVITGTVAYTATATIKQVI